MVNKLKKNQKGITLVEILIYMGLLAILLVILTEMMVSILNVRLESEAISSLEQDARYILSRIAYDINRSDSIENPARPGQSRTNLEMTIDGETYTYEISGSTLQLTTDSGTYNLNGSETNIDDIDFERLGILDKKNSIRIQMTISSVTQRNTGVEEKSYTTTFGER
jgi:type II secretory pathway pseudopilin PulG